jgi:uncharacterized protein
MKRELLERIREWNLLGAKRKPLVLMGARQVGKTWLLKEFSSECYSGATVYVDLHDDEPLKNAIERGAFDARGILDLISTATGKRIEPGKTLLILDEIQESPRTLTSLKYFYEQMPELAIVVAGSLLGLALNREYSPQNGAGKVSFPVGKVSFMVVPPMTFFEFLDAIGEEEKRRQLENCAWSMISAFHETYEELLKRYFLVGGMPEAVSEYAQTHDFKGVRRVQNEILLAYDKDFAKHASMTLLPKIRLLWNAIPSQLARENKKLIYTALRPGARAREYEVALQWLADAGMIHQVRRVSRPGIPLKAYEDFGAFKLYAHDIGLLAALSNLPERVLLEGSELFTHFKGAFTEQYVLGELVAEGVEPYYWTADEGMAEVEFVVQGETTVYPLEVKAGINLQAKSLKAYCARYQVSRGLRVSLAEHHVGPLIDDIPLYAIRSAIRPYLRA